MALLHLQLNGTVLAKLPDNKTLNRSGEASRFLKTMSTVAARLTQPLSRLNLLDPNLDFRLSTGRVVSLTGFFTAETNTWIDHSPSTLKEKVRQVVRKLYAQGDYVLADTDRDNFICVAGFNSSPVKDPNSYGSFLTLVWFVDNNDDQIRNLVQIGLDSCEWESQSSEIYRGQNDD